jgi:hypothetical protein
MMDGNHEEREITWTKKRYTHHDSRQIKTDKNDVETPLITTPASLRTSK